MLVAAKAIEDRKIHSVDAGADRNEKRQLLLRRRPRPIQGAAAAATNEREADL